MNLRVETSRRSPVVSADELEHTQTDASPAMVGVNTDVLDPDKFADPVYPFYGVSKNVSHNPALVFGDEDAFALKKVLQDTFPAEDETLLASNLIHSGGNRVKAPQLGDVIPFRQPECCHVIPLVLSVPECGGNRLRPEHPELPDKLARFRRLAVVLRLVPEESLHRSTDSTTG